MYSMFEDIDQGWDRLLDPNARPNPPSMPGRIPPIAHAEVTTNKKSAREKAYAQLIQHQLVGVPAQGRRGQLDRPMAQQRPRQNVGLALVNPQTGAVHYTVFAPDVRQVLWRGQLGWLSPDARRTPQGRENGVRCLLTRLTGQYFQPHQVTHAGPDLTSERAQPSRLVRRASSAQSAPPSQRSQRASPRMVIPRRPRPNRFDSFDRLAAFF